jgi:type II secretory pathway component PulF
VEFRCRLASTSGEIVEGVYIADNEARLRHELEEKGLYVLSLRPKGVVGGLSFRLPSRSSIPSREFLIFNRTGHAAARRHAAGAAARSA